MSNALAVEEVRFSAQGNKILQGVSLAVAPGEAVGIIGPNGSGKTTLFNVISGFVAHESGSILLHGNEVSSLSAAERARRGLGRVFQAPGVFREMSLVENMVAGLESRSSIWSTFFPWSATYRRYKAEARELLATANLADKADERASSLSGGQLRLLEILRCFATGASVLLFDEPTAGVSPKMKEEVLLLIERVRSQGRTILVIEHDLPFIEGFCSRIVVLNVGQVLLSGTPAEVKANPQLKEIYFGGSQTRQP